MMKLSDMANKAKSAGKQKLGLNGSGGEVTKLKIAYSSKEEEKYEVYLNPNQLSHSIKINFAKKDNATIQAKNSKGEIIIVTPITPVSTEPESLKFQLMLDGTGATGQTSDVLSELHNLSSILFEVFNEENHKGKETLYITWGDLVSFTGHVESFDITYTLFSPNGSPLRATVDLTFLGNSNLTKVKPIDRGEKDTKQMNDINSTMTIVNMCNAIYKSPVSHIAVAKANKLTNIRKLKPGSKLVFPPKKA